MSQAPPQGVVRPITGTTIKVDFPGAGRPFDRFFSVVAEFRPLLGSVLADPVFVLYRGSRTVSVGAHVLHYFQHLLNWRFRDVKAPQTLAGEPVLDFLESEYDVALGRGYTAIETQGGRECLTWKVREYDQHQRWIVPPAPDHGVCQARLAELAPPTTVTVQLPPIQYIKLDATVTPDDAVPDLLAAPPPAAPPVAPEARPPALPPSLRRNATCYLCAAPVVGGVLVMAPVICTSCRNAHLEGAPDGR